MTRRKTIALAIWWCEGTKIRKDKRWKNSYLYPVEITNTDPEIIKIFIDLLINDLNVPISKLHGQLQIHDGDDQDKLEDYWSKITNIPIAQFNKTIIREKGKKVGKSKGTFKLRVYGKILYMKLRQLLDLEIKYLRNGD